MKCVSVVCLVFFLCMAFSCGKRDNRPDLSVYTGKLAGVRVWNHWEQYSSGSTRYFDDDTINIVVNDDEHITMSGGMLGRLTLTYDTYTDDILVYVPEGAGPQDKFLYYFRGDSLTYTFHNSDSHAWSIGTYKTHL